MKENYKLGLSSLRSQLIGIMECWNIGMLDLEDWENAILDKGASPLVPSKALTNKGGHGLHKGSFRLQTMTAFNQKFLQGGPGGAVFSKSAPPGRRRQRPGGENARRH